jgi:hypothetical protein
VEQPSSCICLCEGDTLQGMGGTTSDPSSREYTLIPGRSPPTCSQSATAQDSMARRPRAPSIPSAPASATGLIYF